jgi:hypothetical protein
MRVVRCDTCKAVAELNEFGLPPAGWYVITVQAPSFTKPIECCGVICAIAAIAALQKDP